MQRRATHTVAILACLASLVSFACGGVHGATSSTASRPAICLPADRATLTTCWELVAPLGSGGFPPEQGSSDSPKWAPGRWPLTLEPVIGFHGDLWMMSQTHAWSSTDGLHWAHYPKTDWGERISQAYAFFNGRLWMFGGLRYNGRVPRNDIWSSTDGATWTNAGNADWSPRKGQTITVFRNRLWLFGGADQVKQDFSTIHTLNDVWSSDDGLHWTQRTPPQRGHLARERGWWCSRTRSICLAAMDRRTFGAPMTAFTGPSCHPKPHGSRGMAMASPRSGTSCGCTRDTRRGRPMR